MKNYKLKLENKLVIEKDNLKLLELKFSNRKIDYQNYKRNKRMIEKNIEYYNIILEAN